MRIVIFSDSHGNIARIRHVLGFAKEISASAVIHCGDWDNVEAVRTVLEYGIPLYSVLGNADIDPEVEKILSAGSKKFSHDFLEFEKADKIIAVCHYPGQLRAGMEISPIDIGFHGHTHKRKDERLGNTKLVNPGAISRTDSPSFAVYDLGRDVVEFIDLETIENG